jgi:hypothetical protein
VPTALLQESIDETAEELVRHSEQVAQLSAFGVYRASV